MGGHSSGAVQMWDLTTALEFFNKGEPTVHNVGGPSPLELVRLLEHVDLSNSRPSTPCISPSPSLSIASAKKTAAHLSFVNNSPANSASIQQHQDDHGRLPQPSPSGS